MANARPRIVVTMRKQVARRSRYRVQTPTMCFSFVTGFAPTLI